MPYVLGWVLVGVFQHPTCGYESICIAIELSWLGPRGLHQCLESNYSQVEAI